MKLKDLCEVNRAWRDWDFVEVIDLADFAEIQHLRFRFAKILYGDREVIRFYDTYIYLK